MTGQIREAARDIMVTKAKKPVKAAPVKTQVPVVSQKITQPPRPYLKKMEMDAGQCPPSLKSGQTVFMQKSVVPTLEQAESERVLSDKLEKRVIILEVKAYVVYEEYVPREEIAPGPGQMPTPAQTPHLSVAAARAGAIRVPDSGALPQSSHHNPYAGMTQPPSMGNDHGSIRG